MMKFSLGALVAAGVLAGGFATSASAADLGGNCCADLEERIAELEATTARKGNRKVSLTVSGWVGQQITWWDDGVESNVYVHDLGSTLASHVKFTGQATIAPGWSAGYVLHLEGIGSDSLTTSQNRDNGPAALVGTANGVQTLQSFWFIKSDQLGKVGVGLQSQAADNTAILVDGSGSLVPANWVAFDVNSFGIRSSNPILDGQASWGGGYCASFGGAWGDCDGVPRNVVRYDSPVFAGFSLSASWGEDDLWSIAARYAGEFNGVKVAIASAYSESSDEAMNVALGTALGGGNIAVVNDSQNYFQIGAYAEHVPTGIFGLINYGHNEFDVAPGTSETWYFKAGLRKRLNPLGHTVFYGEYLKAQGDDLLSQTGTTCIALAGAAGVGACGDETKVWGLGVVQEIDAAAMSVWIKYRHLSFDTDTPLGALPFEDFQYVGVGALINF